MYVSSFVNKEIYIKLKSRVDEMERSVRETEHCEGYETAFDLP